MLFPLRDQVQPASAPLLTILIIGLNVTIFLFAWGYSASDGLISNYGFTPVNIIERPTALIGSLFLHANLFHLVSNMWFLWIFGDNVEDRLGRLRYLMLFLLSGVAGNLFHAILTGLNTGIPVIGASGAVAGTMGAYLVMFPRSKIKSLLILVFYPLFFKIPSIILLGLWMLTEFALAILSSPGDHVAHWAHIGGFLCGIVWGFGKRDERSRAQDWWW